MRRKLLGMLGLTLSTVAYIWLRPMSFSQATKVDLEGWSTYRGGQYKGSIEEEAYYYVKLASGNPERAAAEFRKVLESSASYSDDYWRDGSVLMTLDRWKRQSVVRIGFASPFEPDAAAA